MDLSNYSVRCRYNEKSSKIFRLHSRVSPIRPFDSTNKRSKSGVVLRKRSRKSIACKIIQAIRRNLRTRSATKTKQVFHDENNDKNEDDDDYQNEDDDDYDKNEDDDDYDKNEDDDDYDKNEDDDDHDKHEDDDYYQNEDDDYNEDDGDDEHFDHITFEFNGFDEECGPVYETCPLCDKDLIYIPCDDSAYNDEYDDELELPKLPEVAVLACGHSFHSECLLPCISDEHSREPECFLCLSYS